MRQKNSIVFAFLVLAFTASGQIHMTPFVGINNTRFSGDANLRNRANFPFGGIEIEGRIKENKISPLHLSLVTGVSYLANGYRGGFISTFPGYYVSETSDLSTHYLQIPLVVRLNWQPFPLLEDFHLFVGAGLSYDFLLQATLTEESTQVYHTITGGPPAPPQTTHYEDNQDITSLGAKQVLFYRMEFGARFRRLQVVSRISTSSKNLYFEGLEDVWQVPPGSSSYIDLYLSAGKIKATYLELAIAYRIF